MRFWFVIPISWIVLALLQGFAHASPDDPNEQIARGHFARGTIAYNEGRFADALVEFEAAHAAEPLSALDFDIAHCLDRLNRRTEALIAYRRYLAVDPAAYNVGDVQARIALLEHEMRETTPPVPVPASRLIVTRPVVEPIIEVAKPTPRVANRYLVPGLVAGGALALAVVGGALTGSAVADYHTLESRCATSCPSSAWSMLPIRERVGEALLGVAGAVAVVDVVLFVLKSKKRGR